MFYFSLIIYRLYDIHGQTFIVTPAGKSFKQFGGRILLPTRAKSDQMSVDCQNFCNVLRSIFHCKANGVGQNEVMVMANNKNLEKRDAMAYVATKYTQERWPNYLSNRALCRILKLRAEGGFGGHLVEGR